MPQITHLLLSRRASVSGYEMRRGGVKPRVSSQACSTEAVRSRASRVEGWQFRLPRYSSGGNCLSPAQRVHGIKAVVLVANQAEVDRSSRQPRRIESRIVLDKSCVSWRVATDTSLWALIHDGPLQFRDRLTIAWGVRLIVYAVPCELFLTGMAEGVAALARFTAAEVDY
jgi:hypothetical protein